MASGQKIQAENTLIIFDEVQDCPKVINSMKYFCENAPQYHIACAGSLLGIALAKPSSFPVGKVNFLQIDPMTFMEFLMANGDENLVTYLESIDEPEPLPDAFFNPLCEKLKMYYVTGGMQDWCTRCIAAVRQDFQLQRMMIYPRLKSILRLWECYGVLPCLHLLLSEREIVCSRNLKGH